MTIAAKFPSKCSECGGRVFKGDQIEWVRGVRGVRHTNCGEHQPEPEGEPEQPVEETKGNKLTFTFEFSKMTVEQLNALKSLVDGEITRRETPVEPVVEVKA